MRRPKQVGSNLSRTQLSLAVNNTVIPSYLGSVVPEPTAAASPAGNTATAVAEELESHEVPTGSDWPSRPEGVSDDHLYQEWLRLRTPKASVSGKKLKDGTVKRTPYSYSKSVLPQAIALTEDAFSRSDVYVTSLGERMGRSNNSAGSRIRKGQARGNVEDLIHPSASAYALACHQHRVRIWNKVVGTIVEQAKRDHERYDFEERVSARRMEWHENNRDFNPYGVDVPWWEDNASVSSLVNTFVGPLKPAANEAPVMLLTQLPVETPEQIMQRHYEQQRRIKQLELEKAFAYHDNVVPIKRDTKAVTKEAPQQAYMFAPLAKWRESIEAFCYNRKKIYNHKKLCAPHLVREHRKMLADWNEVQGQNVSAVYARSYQRQRLLKMIKDGHNPLHVSPDSISRTKWWEMMNDSHLLVGANADGNTYFEEVKDEAYSVALKSRLKEYVATHKMYRELFGAYGKEPMQIEKRSDAVKVTTVAPALSVQQVGDKAYLSLYKRLVQESQAKAAKAAKAMQEAMKKATVTFNGVKFAPTETGLLLPLPVL